MVVARVGAPTTKREGRGPELPLDLAPRPSFVGWRELKPACPSLSSSGDTCEATYEICINLSPTAHTRGTSALREQNQGLEKAPMAFSSDFPLERGLLAHGQTQIDREVHSSKRLRNVHNCCVYQTRPQAQRSIQQVFPWP